jgi:hypothetical protein
MYRRLLLLDPATHRWRLETLPVETLEKDPREDYFVLSGEALCQYLLRRDPGALVVARGPLPFLSGNKATIGYLSPLTGLPHYSLVGGRAAAQLLNLGLDAICFQSGNQQISKSANRQVNESANLHSPFSILHSPFSILPIVVVSGRAPDLTVEFEDAAELPSGQRSAFYWLLERELGGDKYGGSIFTLGEGARLGYASANLAVEAIYHAGRGGAGAVFARFASALVLRGRPVELSEFFAGLSPLPAGEGRGEGAFARNPNDAIAPLLDIHCARLSGKTGGTIVKLYTSGADPTGKHTLPARNAQQMGTPVADLGSPQVLKATRQGQTGCHWCQVDCRHYHYVPADYAPGGQDIFLDDFEPTYAVFAMLGLAPAQDTLQARLDLRAEVDRRLLLPLEQMGCDVMNVGTGLAALFEGVERGLIPRQDVPDFIASGGGLGAPSAKPPTQWGVCDSLPRLGAAPGDGSTGGADATLRPGGRISGLAGGRRRAAGAGRALPGDAGRRVHRREGHARERGPLQCIVDLPDALLSLLRPLRRPDLQDRRGTPPTWLRPGHLPGLL